MYCAGETTESDDALIMHDPATKAFDVHDAGSAVREPCTDVPLYRL